MNQNPSLRIGITDCGVIAASRCWSANRPCWPRRVGGVGDDKLRHCRRCGGDSGV